MGNLKIQDEHLEHLRTAIEAEMAKDPDIVEKYETGQFPRADKVKDLQTRFNFDMLNRAVPAKWVCDNLYPYMDDNHIASALKHILPTVTRRY